MKRSLMMSIGSALLDTALLLPTKLVPLYGQRQKSLTITLRSKMYVCLIYDSNNKSSSSAPDATEFFSSQDDKNR